MVAPPIAIAGVRPWPSVTSTPKAAFTPSIPSTVSTNVEVPSLQEPGVLRWQQMDHHWLKPSMVSTCLDRTNRPSQASHFQLALWHQQTEGEESPCRLTEEPPPTRP